MALPFSFPALPFPSCISPLVHALVSLVQKGIKAAAQPAAVQPKRVPVVPEVLPPAPVIPPVQADVSMKEEDDLCQAFSDVLCPIEDIDRGDADIPQLCSEYVKDIYVYLRSLEVGLSASRACFFLFP